MLVPTHAYAMKEEPRETGRTGRIQDRQWGWAGMRIQYPNVDEDDSIKSIVYIAYKISI